MKDSKTPAEDKEATACETEKAKGAKEPVTSAKDAKKVDTSKPGNAGHKRTP